MSASELVATGILMGILHVLTGPDHLSALATLCGTSVLNVRVDGSDDGRCRRRLDAFLLGVRWGLGHSLGLLAAGGILIALEDASGEWIGMDPTIRSILEGFVGAFMLALGVYGALRADRNRRESVLVLVVSENESQVKSLKMQCYEDDDEEGAGAMEDGTGHGTEGGASDLVSRMSEVLDLDDDRSQDGLSQTGTLDDYSFRDLTSTDLALQNYLEDAANAAQSLDMSFVTIPMTLMKPSSKTKQKKKKKKAASDAAAAAPDPKEYVRRATVQSSNKTRRRPTATSLMQKHTSERYLGGGWWTERCCSFRSCYGMGRGFFECSPAALALCAGVLHGVAGPGGVLGVIPAVQLRDATLAATYLGSFCVTSTFVMGTFAASYGTLSEWMAGSGRRRGGGGDRVYVVQLGSALLSICVGIVWLVLLALGRLDEVFP
ncbi:hypothetical protein ACHAWF_005736 [Thalassiosira exigua]